MPEIVGTYLSAYREEIFVLKNGHKTGTCLYGQSPGHHNNLIIYGLDHLQVNRISILISSFSYCLTMCLGH